MTPDEARQKADAITDGHSGIYGGSGTSRGDRPKLRDAIAAALLEAAGEWQPIETAPRDGTEILLATTLFDGEPVIVSGWWFSSPKEIDDGWETPVGFHGDPPHWRHLPAPPEQK